MVSCYFIASIYWIFKVHRHLFKCEVWVTIKSKKGYKAVVSYTNTDSKKVTYTVKSGKSKTLTFKATTKVSVKSYKNNKVKCKGSYTFTVKSPVETKAFKISECGLEKIGTTKSTAKTFYNSVKIKVTAKKGYNVVVKVKENGKWVNKKTINSKKSATLTFKKNTSVRVYYKKSSAKKYSYENYNYAVNTNANIVFDTDLVSGTYKGYCATFKVQVTGEAEVYYTLDGTTPTKNSKRCAGTIRLTTGNYTVKLRGYDWENEAYGETYTYNIVVETPSFEEVFYSHFSNGQSAYTIDGVQTMIYEDMLLTITENKIDFSDMAASCGWEFVDSELYYSYKNGTERSVDSLMKKSTYNVDGKFRVAHSNNNVESNCTFRAYATFKQVDTGEKKEVVLFEESYSVFQANSIGTIHYWNGDTDEVSLQKGGTYIDFAPYYNTYYSLDGETFIKGFYGNSAFAGQHNEYGCNVGGEVWVYFTTEDIDVTTLSAEDCYHFVD